LKQPGRTFSDPLLEITDLAGLRIILHYQDDVDAVVNLVESEFVVHAEHSSDKRETMAVDQFGYLSVHLVASLSPSRVNLSEYSVFKDLFIEIQIRTVLQHAWAAISHALDYKRVEAVPKAFRRKLIRLSGLLELADEQFSDLRRSRLDLAADLQERFTEKDFLVDLDTVSVEQYLKQARPTKVIAAAVQKNKIGLISRATGDGDGPDGLAQLLTVCKTLSVRSVAELDTRLEKSLHIAPKFFEKFRQIEGDGIEISGSMEHWCAVLLVASHKPALKLKTLSSPYIWPRPYSQQILSASKNL
jgi:ppGpp synthetase/RelA/SpoT-type nucleotidyltranferase